MTTLKPFDIISSKSDVLPKLGYGLFWLVLFVASLGAGKNAYAAVQCDKNISANVVVLDNPTVFNRLGAQNPNWITYALERDVVHWDDGNPLDSNNGKPCSKIREDGGKCIAGKVQLRPDKRPRPLVVRSVEGACLNVTFTNLLDPVKANPNKAQQGQATRTTDPNWKGLFNDDQVLGRCASFHATGTEVRNIKSLGAWVGDNPDAEDGFGGPLDCGGMNSGLAGPNETVEYQLYTPHEGAYIISSYGATIGSEANSGNLAVGMFGALNVQPKGAKIYRSQVTEEEMRLATSGTNPGNCSGPSTDTYAHGVQCDPGGQPIINYEAKYPNVEPWISEGKAGLPIINMLTDSGELVHSDINAIIAGPCDDGSWQCKFDTPEAPYPLERVGKNNPAYPNRLEAFREFTSQYHDEQTNSQVFPNWYNHPTMRHVLHGVKDQFMINYGSGGIGSEIISNRLRTGPMHDCTDCAYEEFFLASQTVGDPALLVNYPANTGIEACSPENIAADINTEGGNACWRIPAMDTTGDGVINTGLANGPVQFPTGETDEFGNPKFALADNYALFQEDPSNVHHAYTGDFVKMRNTHAGSFEQHIFHFHNHQWLFNPNDDSANYLDAQEIMPGSGHTYELVNGGAGNRNKTVGDAIFHCHFYPHFAQGMWYHMRNHDVFETGTVLAVSDGPDGIHEQPWELRSGKPAAGARALPDGELPDGTPIPAIVPLPGKAMPQMPAKVSVAAVDRGSNSLLGGRVPPDPANPTPDSSQAIVDRASVWGADGKPNTADDVTPGYPFFLAGNECGPDQAAPAVPGEPLVGANVCPMGIVGQRMPTPPLDMLTDAGAAVQAGNPFPGRVDWSNLGGGWDGGLPRHAMLGYTAGGVSKDTQNRLDFAKIIEMSRPVYFPEIGTDLERVSMAYQAERFRKSQVVNLDGTKAAGDFVLNGAAPVPSGPYNDPCVDDNGDMLRADNQGYWFDGDGDPNTLLTMGRSAFDGENPRTYKLANLQIDAVFNKVGYHYSQERIIILWEDVKPTVLKERPPEPLVMRFNTFDCGKILHANLVPAEFEVDDFQVRTPTDVIGQHIHLPKWDLTSNDGAANGWNYEDGTLSPKMVIERIFAINRYNGLIALGNDCINGLGGSFVDPADPEKIYTCEKFTTSAAGGPVLKAGSLPGQLGPVDLTGLPRVASLKDSEGADPGAISAKAAFELFPTDHYFAGFTDPSNPQVKAGMYLGARTTIQRLLVDPVVNVAGIDRGLGLTFSHDHYGPSTFQQVGLYSTILAEPAGSTWRHNESGEPLGWQNASGETVDIDGYRNDGGPTSWQAAILPPSGALYGSTVKSEEIPPHREFYFEMSDFQHAYELGTYVGANEYGIPLHHDVEQPNPFNATVATAPGIQDTWKKVVNPTLKLTANNGVNPGAFPDTVNAHPGCPGPGTGPNGPGQPTQNDPDVPRPCAEAINIGHASMWVVNFRNEPIGLRVFDPDKMGPDGKKGSQAGGYNEKGNYIDPKAGDLAFALMTRTDRAIPELNTQFGAMPYPVFDDFEADTAENPYKPIYVSKDSLDPTKAYCDGINCDRRPGDPITPIMRAYERDHVKVKIQVGATEEQHQTTIHGMKWLSNGSGFGRSGNSGWRNFQSHGISEQFSLQVPITTAPQQPGDVAEYLYATDATRDGMWSGTWGILRAYRDKRTDLFELDGDNGNPAGQTLFVNNVDPTDGYRDFNGVCPSDANVAHFDVSAVLANDVLPNKLNVMITANTGGDSDGDSKGDNVGGPLKTDGGTLVYNRRDTEIPGAGCVGGNCAGPLNDPTAIMYVLTSDLEVIDPTDPGCYGTDPVTGDAVPTDNHPDPVILPTCPVKLKDTAPVEPLVLRANAGDCIEVDLRNRLPEVAPDLAGWLDTFWVVNRDLGREVRPAEMSFFGNNLIRPSSYVGLHPQLVAYDINQHDGVQVGATDDFGEEFQLAPPGGSKSYRWYAGDTRFEVVDPSLCATDTDTKGGGPKKGGGPGKGDATCVEIVATPVEFGAVNLLSADRIKQPQKGLFGALVIEPAGATVAVDTMVPDGQGMGTATRPTRAQVTVTADAGPAGSGGTYREALAIAHKLTNLRWKDGSAIKNVGQAEFGVEGAEDSGHAGFNYGMEPSWFRFKLPPDADVGNAGTLNSYGSIPNPQAMYSNALVAGEGNAIPEILGVSKAGDPQTPVFIAKPDPLVTNPDDPTAVANPVFDTRMYLLNGASPDRDSTFVLTGHLWPRDPYVCTGAADNGATSASPQDDQVPGLVGRCDPHAAVPSNALGFNPQAKWMASEEGMGHVFAHWPILFDAGGTGAVQGDYLYRDYAPNGNRNGMFGILRVTTDPTVAPPPDEEPPPPQPCEWYENMDADDPNCKNPNKGGGRNK